MKLDGGNLRPKPRSRRAKNSPFKALPAEQASPLGQTVQAEAMKALKVSQPAPNAARLALVKLFAFWKQLSQQPQTRQLQGQAPPRCWAALGDSVEVDVATPQ